MSPTQKLVTAEILSAVCAHYSIAPEELESPARLALIAWPRMVSMYLIRHHTGAIWREISALFHRQQSTAPHAYNAVRDRLTVDSKFARDLHTLEAYLHLKPSA